jgi:hypothetical protein
LPPPDVRPISEAVVLPPDGLAIVELTK